MSDDKRAECDCEMYGPAHFDDCALVKDLRPGEAVLQWPRALEPGFFINLGVKQMRHFESGATRDAEEGKLDYEAFLAPAVLTRYAEYMHACRVQSDGELRDGDNWQKGIPRSAYMKSMFRHFMEVWRNHRAGTVNEDALCALLFNVMGYLFEVLQGR